MTGGCETACLSQGCLGVPRTYSHGAPKLWAETIETHRREVSDAILDAAAELVADRGVRAVTMSEIAQAAGIGRATLYRYFSDVDAILATWHERQVAHHLRALRRVGDAGGDLVRRLTDVLERYALSQHEHRGSDGAARLHAGPYVERGHDLLREYLAELIAEGAREGTLRGDVAATELAAFAFHALDAAPKLSSKAAVRRLVAVTMAGLRRPDS